MSAYEQQHALNWHEDLGGCVLCWWATADEQGQPNVSPKEVFAVVDDQHLLIANIASPVSVRNIQHNPKVCVSIIDIFVQALPILAPSYRFYPDSTTESGQIESAMKAYGVRPVKLV